MAILNLLFFKQNVNIARVPSRVEQPSCILNVCTKAKITTVAIKQINKTGGGQGDEKEINCPGDSAKYLSVCQWVPWPGVCICTSVFLFQL